MNLEVMSRWWLVASHKQRSALDTGVWNGHSYDDAPAISEGNEDICDKRVDGPRVSTQSTGKEEEGDLEHDGETLDKKVEWPFIETLTPALTVSTSLHHRSSCVSQVAVEPLLG